MADAPLDPDGGALWRRVVATVRPLKGRARMPATAADDNAVGAERQTRDEPLPVAPSSAARRDALPARRVVQNTLDATWDKRLRQGMMAPDATIDLHGYTVAAAHEALEAELARAVARQARLVLLVTGRGPPPGRSRLDNPLRGVIRASIGDWLHHSRHARDIAAVRNAHPRHGGAGALYVVLRRARA